MSITTEQRIKRVAQRWRAFQSEMDQLFTTMRLTLAPYVTNKPQIKVIQETVAAYYMSPATVMASASRVDRYILPRHAAMYLCRQLTSYSLEEIAEDFGGRNHGTIINAWKKIAAHRTTDAKLSKQLDELERLCTDRLENIETPLFRNITKTQGT